MNSFLKSIVAAGFSAMVLTACSASVTGGEAPKVQQKEEPQIEGPSLNGLWVTNCEPDMFSGGYTKITMVIKDKQVSRTTELFNDYDCRGRTDSETKNGTFFFQEKYEKEIYKVLYTFETPERIRRTENIRRDGKSLWISNFIEGADAEPYTELKQVGEAQ